MAFLMVQNQQLEKMKTMWLISKYSVWNFYTRGNYLKIRGLNLSMAGCSLYMS